LIITLHALLSPFSHVYGNTETMNLYSSSEEILKEVSQYSENSVDIQGFFEEVQKYSNEYFPELADENYLQNLIQGNQNIENQNLLNKILNVLIGEFQSNISLILKIVGIAILCSILKSIQLNFGDNGVGEIAFYMCYLMVVTLIVTSFTSVVYLCTDTIKQLSNFMNMVIPLIFALMAVTGSITSISFLQPFILGMIALISFLLNRFIVPIIYLATIIQIVTNISKQITLDKIAELLKKTSLWVMEISLLIFGGVLSLEGTLAASVDGMTTKIAKNVVSSTIPVVGKILGDTVDSVIGGIAITKNAIGFIGILAILAITISPLIKSLITMLVFNLSAAFIEPIADSRISKCMNSMAGSLKIIVGIMAVVIFIFIIAITMMLKISNTTLMYR